MGKGQFMLGTEWNVDSHLTNYAANTKCNSTVCVSSNSVVIGEQKSLASGWCAGELIWGYTHLHNGGIEGIMSINGKEYCKSVPRIGTDPHNIPPNEKGYVVDISTCVDKLKKNNSVVLKKGDVMTVTSFYDVDPTSQRNAPFPGGKHGGIMALFFGVMHCDRGTYGERYVCRQGTCVGVKKNIPSFMRSYDDYDSCDKSCNEETPTESEDTLAVVPADQKPVEMKTTPMVGSPKIGRVAVEWNDCGNGQAASKIVSMTPNALSLGGKTNIVGTGMLSQSISGGNFSVKMASGLAGLTLFDFSGDLCTTEKKHSLDGLMSLTWEGMTCPLPAGSSSVTVGLYVSSLIPPIAASTTTTVVATDTAGDTIFCMEVLTEGFQSDYDLLI